MEYVGHSEKRSITVQNSVIVEDDDMIESVPDETRLITDEQIVFSRKLALMNHYPNIDILVILSCQFN